MVYNRVRYVHVFALIFIALVVLFELIWGVLRRYQPGLSGHLPAHAAAVWCFISGMFCMSDYAENPGVLEQMAEFEDLELSETSRYRKLMRLQRRWDRGIVYFALMLLLLVYSVVAARLF